MGDEVEEECRKVVAEFLFLLLLLLLMETDPKFPEEDEAPSPPRPSFKLLDRLL